MKKFIYDSSILEKQMVTQNNCQRIDKIKLSGALHIEKSTFKGCWLIYDSSKVVLTMHVFITYNWIVCAFELQKYYCRKENYITI